MEEQQQKFLKLIKIRIGEPITAIDIFKENVIFGAISGYIGMYKIKENDLKYINEVFEEIIRGIYITQENKAFIAVGDYQAIILDLSDINNKQLWKKYLFENHLSKNPNLCASTISFLYEDSIAMMVASPTQNKDALFDITQQKQIINIFDFNLWTTPRNITQIDMPAVFVPFDYDKERILIMEYKPNCIKSLQLFQIQNQQFKEIYVFNKSVQYISHAKLIQNYIIYVQDHKHLKIMDLNTKQIYPLYSHSEPVQAISVNLQQPNQSKQQQQQQQQQQLESDVEKQQGIQQINDIQKLKQQLILATIDYAIQLKIYKNGSIIYDQNMLKLPNVQENVFLHKYLFDMGYPYYLVLKNNIVAFSTDLGICVYQL